MLDWLITSGFFAVLIAVALRIVVMMRASDAGGAATAAQHGRQLVYSYRKFFPASRIPLVSMLMLLFGGACLVAGLWIRVVG
jgi:hypothetical protein